LIGAEVPDRRASAIGSDVREGATPLGSRVIVAPDRRRRLTGSAVTIRLTS
jgi:hypothetical protein